jgi:hypothetical protein
MNLKRRMFLLNVEIPFIGRKWISGAGNEEPVSGF